MNRKLSRVVAIKLTDSYPNTLHPEEKIYEYRIAFENDDIGVFRTSSEQQYYFQEGQESLYEITPGKDPKDSLTITIPENIKSNTKFSTASMVMSYAKDLYVAGKVDSLEEMYSEFDTMFEKIMQKVVLKI